MGWMILERNAPEPWVIAFADLLQSVLEGQSYVVEGQSYVMCGVIYLITTF